MTYEKVILAQISDIHIGPTEAPYQGIAVRENFLKALEACKAKKPDLLVLSGDIAAEDGEAGAYQWVAKIMSEYPYPWVVMGGNHDRIPEMAKFFDINSDLIGEHLCFKRVVKGRTVFFLDSSSDYLATSQLEWLQKEASKVDDEVLLFVHHPPAISGCLFMDTKYPLKNIEETRKYLKGLHNLHNIFVGHYHTEKFIVQDGKNIHLTPSTAMQIDSTTPHFHMEHIRPGWRTIEWLDGRLDTEVHYGLEAPSEISDKEFF